MLIILVSLFILVKISKNKEIIFCKLKYYKKIAIANFYKVKMKQSIYFYWIASSFHSSQRLFVDFIGVKFELKRN